MCKLTKKMFQLSGKQLYYVDYGTTSAGVTVTTSTTFSLEILLIVCSLRVKTKVMTS